jgi:hypothetical protein
MRTGPRAQDRSAPSSPAPLRARSGPNADRRVTSCGPASRRCCQAARTRARPAPPMTHTEGALRQPRAAERDPPAPRLRSASPSHHRVPSTQVGHHGSHAAPRDLNSRPRQDLRGGTSPLRVEPSGLAEEQRRSASAPSDIGSRLSASGRTMPSSVSPGDLLPCPLAGFEQTFGRQASYSPVSPKADFRQTIGKAHGAPRGRAPIGADRDPTASRRGKEPPSATAGQRVGAPQRP